MLYQKIRPKSLDDIVGNEAMVAALHSVLGQESKPHVFLFAGPSGCAKTTLARIVASRLGCDLDVGLLEINAAEARGIDTIREIQRQVPFSPIRGNAKVVLFDEAHMLTPQAQQSLLKILEDMPEHQYFILCSTEPDRIISTIRNRCAVYGVKKLRKPQMKELLNKVIAELDLSIEPEVIDFIEIAAEGSPRQALVRLEQVMGLPAEQALDAIEGGTQLQKNTKDLCQFLLKGNVDKALSILSSISDEPERIRRAVVGYMDAVVRGKSTKEHIRDVALSVLGSFLSADTYRNGKWALTYAIFSGRSRV